MEQRKIRNVAVALFESDFRRDLCTGIVRFARRRPDWRFEMYRGTPYIAATLLNRWRGDGLIGIAGDEADVELLSKPGCPVVSVAKRLLTDPFPTVTSDNAAIGRMVASHLLDLGLRHFAFFGNHQTVAFSHERYAGFVTRLVEAGVDAASILAPQSRSDRAPAKFYDPERIAAELRKSPNPVGVFCENDAMAASVVQACKHAGLEIPNTVVVVGCDNDAALCEMQYPAITSVDRNTDEIGFRAAELLDRLMDGSPTPTETIRVPAKGLVHRLSSDVLAVPDTDVAAAIRFIRNHAAEDISVDDVVDAVAVSRRVLEMRFRTHLDRTIHQEIRHTHIAHARQLMLTTDLSLAAISRQCGFNHTSQFRVAFRNELGMSPRDFVRLHRAKQA